MPDINFPNAVVSGQPPASSDISENLYKPRSTPNTLGVVNGFLTMANLTAGTLPIPQTVVAPGQFAGGSSTGSTSSTDYFSDWFSATATPRADIDDVGVAIPGAGITYELPYTCSVVYVRWQMGVIADGGDSWDYSGSPPLHTTNTGAGIVKLFVDNHPVATHYVNFLRGRWSVPDRTKTKWSYNNSMIYPDHRWMTCEAAFYVGDPHSALSAVTRKPYARGLHTATIRLAHDTDTARVKVRNMTYSYQR